MASRLPLTDKSGEVRELQAEDFARMRPAKDVLPEIMDKKVAAEMLRKKKHVIIKRKAEVTVELDEEVVDYLKSTGRNWKSKINTLLKSVIEKKAA